MKERKILLDKALDLIERHSVTAYEIEQNTSLSAVGVQKIINKETKKPLQVTLETIISYIERKYEYQEEEVLKEENKARSVFEPENAEDEPTGYYYPNVNASAGLDISTLNEDIERLPMYLPLFGKGVDYINVYGDSMYPKYNAGEVIGVKETEFEYLNYGYPYVVVFNNGDVYIKYVKKGKDENHVLLESENAFYEPREFHLELIKSFYSIRGVVKKEMM